MSRVTPVSCALTCCQVQEHADGIQVLEDCAIYEGFGYKKTLRVPDDVATLTQAAVMAGCYKKCADRLNGLVSKLSRTSWWDTGDIGFIQ